MSYKDMKTDKSRRNFAVGFALGTATAQKGDVLAVASPLNETAITVVLVHRVTRALGTLVEYVVWYHNAQTNGFHGGDYHDNEADAWRVFAERVTRGLPSELEYIHSSNCPVLYDKPNCTCEESEGS